MYPFEKYRYIIAGNKIIAITTYARKTVRGVATCSKDDVFDVLLGKKIAALRCSLKVANKRLKRAKKQLDQAKEYYNKALVHKEEKMRYFSDAVNEVEEVKQCLDKVMKSK